MPNKVAGSIQPDPRKFSQDLHTLLEVLETIEKCQEPTNSRKAYVKSKEKDSDKRKVSFKKEEHVPKKTQTSTKMCILCKEHGGTHTTHISGDCRRYKKEGTLKKGFKNTKTPSGSKPAGQYFAQATKTEFSKLRKSIKRTRLTKRKGNIIIMAILPTTPEALG